MIGSFARFCLPLAMTAMLALGQNASAQQEDDDAAPEEIAVVSDLDQEDFAADDVVAPDAQPQRDDLAEDGDDDELPRGEQSGAAVGDLGDAPANRDDGDDEPERPAAGEPAAATPQPAGPVPASPMREGLGDEGRFAEPAAPRAGSRDGSGGRDGFGRGGRPSSAVPSAGPPADGTPAAGQQVLGPQAVGPQGPGAGTPAARQGVPAASRDELVFNFAGADWRMVLDWLAEQADLSLQVDRYPSGTVNYIDTTRTYTLNQAMDILNRLLMDRGFALVRRGRLLMLVDLEADNARALISELAELVSINELDTRGESDIVRAIFPLGGLAPDAARQEITQLIGPAGRVIVLDSSRQVDVTDTVSRLRAIRTLLSNATTTSSDVTEIVLKHRVADEVLEVARPLIGLEPGANSSDKIRIATSLIGDRLFATGDAATRELLKGIIERADTPLQLAPTDGDAQQAMPRLETYPVSTANSSTVMDVLQTLFAGVPDTRMTIDPQTGGIIVLARPETHQMVKETIDKLEGRGATFEIIQLRRLEPSQALLTINKFFGTSEAGRKDVPTVDGDPVTGRLWVRGTPEQIEMIKSLIERLEGADTQGPFGDRVRVLPYTGRSAEETVEQLQSLWETIGRKNRIRMVSPSAGGRSASNGNSFPQRRVGGLMPNQPRSDIAAEEQAVASETPASAAEPDRREERFERDPRTLFPPDEAHYRGKANDSQLRGEPAGATADDATTLVSDTSPSDLSPFLNQSREVDSDTPRAQPDGNGDIVITMTPGGMIVASDDPIALAEFEQMMRTLNDQTSMAGAQPTVFWLKYAKAPETADLVTRILGGGDSGGGGGGGGGLAGAMLGELGGGMLGGLLGLGGGGDTASGPILTTTGSVSIVADGRLNALIVQANALDMQTIEMILEVVDREESPEDVRTTSKPQLIPVIYQNAADVATIVKGVYADRSSEQGGSRQQQQVSPQDLINALRGGGGGRGGRGGGGNNEQTTKPAPVNIAVDTRSNSLIVTAPPQDVEDIRELVEAIDAGGMQSEETVEIVSLKGNLKADVVQQALDSVLGTRSRSTTSTQTAASGSGSTGGTSSSGGGESASSDDIRRRIEFFQQMRERGGFGGGPPSSSGGSPMGGFGGSSRGGFGSGAPSSRGGTSTRGSSGGSTRGSSRGSR